MTAQTPSLSTIADSLADTFPAADDAPLALALLALLARGESVTDAQLAAGTNRPQDEVSGALARWPNVHRDGRDAVVAFSGLSLRPTEHRFQAGGRELFTWCAESFCCHVHFIAGPNSAQRWLSEHPGGRVLALTDAYKVGRRATERLRMGTAALE